MKATQLYAPTLTIEFAMHEFNRMKDTYYIDENGELVGYEIENNIPTENELVTEMGEINYNITKSINEFTEYTESIFRSDIAIDESVLSNISEKVKNLIKWICKKLYNACRLMKASLMKAIDDIRDTSTKYFDFFKYGEYDCTIKWFRDGFYTEVISPLRNSDYLNMSSKEIELCDSMISFAEAIKRNENMDVDYNGWNQLLSKFNSSLVSMRASECIDFQNNKNALNILRYIETFINNLEDGYKKGTEMMRDNNDDELRSMSVQKVTLFDKSEEVVMHGKEAQDFVKQYFAYVNKVIKFHLKTINDTHKLMHHLLSLWKVNTMRCEAVWKKIEENAALRREKKTKLTSTNEAKYLDTEYAYDDSFSHTVRDIINWILDKFRKIRDSLILHWHKKYKSIDKALLVKYTFYKDYPSPEIIWLKDGYPEKSIVKTLFNKYNTKYYNALCKDPQSLYDYIDDYDLFDKTFSIKPYIKECRDVVNSLTTMKAYDSEDFRSYIGVRRVYNCIKDDIDALSIDDISKTLNTFKVNLNHTLISMTSKDSIYKHGGLILDSDRLYNNAKRILEKVVSDYSLFLMAVHDMATEILNNYSLNISKCMRYAE